MSLAFLMGCGGAEEGGDELASTLVPQSDTGQSDLESDDGFESVNDGGDAIAPELEPDVSEPVCPAPTGLRPTAIAEMVGVPVEGGFVFFGGDNGFPIQCSSNPNPQGELWLYDAGCSQWTLIEVDGLAPGARTRATGVLDTQDNRMLVFGGRYREAKEGNYDIYNEVWALDLDDYTWELLETSGEGPSPRWSSAGTYDPIRHKLIITTGNDGVSGANYSPTGDTFSLDLASGVWSPVGVSGSQPIDRLFGATTYDPVRDAMVLFGGTTAFFGPMLNDVWLFHLDTETWELLSMGTGKAPEKRFWGSINYDEGADRYVAFGGHDDGVLGNRNDIWVFSPGPDVWGRATGGDLLNPDAPSPGFCDFPTNFVLMEEDSPERRSMHLAIGDGEGGVMVMGGKTDCGIVDDVWKLHLQDLSWELLQEPTVGVSCERYGIEGCDAFCF